MPKARRRRKATRSKPRSKANARKPSKARKTKARPKRIAARRVSQARPAPRRGPQHVKVPKTPKNAYDPDRPISDLVKNQIRYMQAAEQSLPTASRSLMPVAAITTERDASQYIQQVTQQLHPGSGGAPAVRSLRRRPSKRTK